MLTFRFGRPLKHSSSERSTVLQLSKDIDNSQTVGESMAKPSRKTVYRVMFVHQDKMYELYCKSVSQSELYGFLEIEELIFGERSNVVVDPGEERLKTEFAGVRRSYIPIHSVVRVDEVDQEGINRIRDHKASGSASVTPFPQGSRPGRE